MTISPQKLRDRRGRLLVECLVAMLLLNACTLVVVSFARDALRSTQTAQLTTSAWALASRSIEAATAAQCATGAGVGTDRLPRLAATWTDRAQSGWRERKTTILMSFSPLTHASPAVLSSQAAWSCQ